MVDPSPQQRRKGRKSETSRKGYPDHSVLGGEVGLWSSALNSEDHSSYTTYYFSLERKGERTVTWAASCHARASFS
jgi:hypothetical protein